MKLVQQARILIKGNETEIMDVLFDERQIMKIAEHIDPALTQEAIPAGSYMLLSGLVDVHAHLREPGYTHKEAVANGAATTTHDDFATIMAMPNVIPYPDSTGTMETYLTKIKQGSRVHMIPYTYIIKAEASHKLNDTERLSAMGIHAFSGGGVGVATADVMKAAMQKCREVDGIIVTHTEDISYRRPNTCMHEDIHSKQPGLTGIPSACRYAQFQRILALVKKTGCRYHVCHMSAQESVESLRRARKEGLDVSGEVTAHRLLLNEMAVEDANHKTNPPLCSEEDYQALIQGLLDGTIDMIASDYAPHSEEEKSGGIKKAPFGIIVLETAFPLLYTRFMKEGGIFALEQLVYQMGEVPTRRFRMERRGKLKKGNTSDFVLMDLDNVRKIEERGSYSMGKSTPLDGIVCSGFAVRTFADGICVYNNREGLLK